MRGFLLMLFFVGSLFGGEKEVFKPVSQGLEYTLLKLHMELNKVNIKQGLEEQINGVEDPYFNGEWIDKVVKAAEKGGTGEYVDYFPDGKIRAKVPYKNGFLNGHVHGWYSSGSDAFKGYYKEGVRQGIHITFFYEKEEDSAANRQRVLQYDEKGLLHGDQWTYYSSAKLESCLTFNHGILDGTAMLYENQYVPPRRSFMKKSYMTEERVYEKGVFKSAKSYSTGLHTTKGGSPSVSD